MVKKPQLYTNSSPCCASQGPADVDIVPRHSEVVRSGLHACLKRRAITVNTFPLRGRWLCYAGTSDAGTHPTDSASRPVLIDMLNATHVMAGHTQLVLQAAWSRAADCNDNPLYTEKRRRAAWSGHLLHTFYGYSWHPQRAEHRGDHCRYFHRF
eukprot:GHVU01043318.1.p1 GENE.GHVU01043318.1~~GHVU01043318.1.p1  ORF type:complete len:154 (-),score=6.85 GHVU01043318.1:403-864(-)